MRKIITLLILLLAGCVSNQNIYIDPSLNTENAARIIIYRPSTEWLGLAIDYRVFINGKYIGSLATSGQVETLAPQGKHTLSVNGYFAGIPDRDYSTSVEASKEETYYIRYSQHMDNIIYIPNMPTVITGNLQLQQVDKSTWEKRK